MKIQMTDIDGKEYHVKDLTQIIITETVGVACASLCFKFKSKEKIGEIVSVKAYSESSAVFNGFCDCQRVTADSSGFETYIYARSSVSILVDSQSKPFTFNCPSARQLWAEYARALGFEYSMPEISCNEKYEVSSGTSCFGAINNFVSALTGCEMIITPENKICLGTVSEDVRSLNGYTVLSASAVINRSEPVGEICYKREQDTDYITHYISKLAMEKGLNRTRYVNINSVAQWQRTTAVSQKMKGFFNDYMLLEITVKGVVSERLYQRFSYSGEVGSFDDYILTEKKYIFDNGNEKTRLVLRKNIDMEEMVYVD
ncbi:MAG: hypothetical protein ACI4V4_04870 [Eubacterium sp.]